jgi:hypothetical protein
MAGENPRTIHSELYLFHPTINFNGYNFSCERNTSQIAAPMASTRYQQSLERISGLFLEKLDRICSFSKWLPFWL